MSHLSLQEFFAAQAIVDKWCAARHLGADKDAKTSHLGELLTPIAREHGVQRKGSSKASDAALVTGQRSALIQACMDTRWQMVLQMVADLLVRRGGHFLREFAGRSWVTGRSCSEKG